MSFSLVKLKIYTPEECLNTICVALNELGACTQGNYDMVCSYSRVTGTWRPLPGSTPYKGTIGKVCTAEEYKLEVRCPTLLLEQALDTIKKIHPYEEPVMHIIPLFKQ